MAVTKTAKTQVGSFTDLADGTSYLSNSFDVTDGVAIGLEISLSFGGAPSGTVNIQVLGSLDNTTWSDKPLWESTETLSGDATLVYNIENITGVPYVMIKIDNNSGVTLSGTINISKAYVIL